jgi:hypothetical protein
MLVRYIVCFHQPYHKWPTFYNMFSIFKNGTYNFGASLHLGSSNHELSFFLFLFGLNQLIFLPKWCHVGLALICDFLVFNLHLKVMGPFYGDQPIRLFYFIEP